MNIWHSLKCNTLFFQKGQGVSSIVKLSPKYRWHLWCQVYICPWCDSVFRTEKERKEHLLTSHGIEVKEDQHQDDAAPEASDQKEKVCNVCDKKFLKPSQLVRHMRVHTGERPFACLMCRKSFNQKNSLQIHMKKHTGERPHVCPYCQYAFTQKGNLKTHIQRNHSSLEKPSELSVD